MKYLKERGYQIMEKEKVNVVGVIGAGRIGRLHINNMRNMPNVRLKTVSDPQADHMKDWFSESGVENLTKDYKNIIDDPEINVVFICAPTSLHVQIITEAAKAGKHIFCEKPICFSDENTCKAHKVVKQAGVKFQLGFNRRFDRNFAKTKELVKNKAIGDLHILKIQSRDPEPPSLEYVSHSGGIFMDMSIHDFDMARFISGSEVEEVYVVGGALINPEFKQYEDIDTALITLKFENGLVGVIDNSRQAVYGYDQQLEAFGSKGSAKVNNEKESSVEVLLKEGVKSSNPLHFFLERYNDAFIEEVEQFFEAINNDEEVPCGFVDGIMAQRIASAAKESLLTGLPIKVEKYQ
ncbi:inositol 2-dehydrogenase [Virgibacillus chiguensis]|nr:inositol 2-dehydrogenase [Virgibacillus chiguensis]